MNVDELLKDSSGWRRRDTVVQESNTVQRKTQGMSEQARGKVFIKPIVGSPCVVSLLTVECLKFSSHILTVERDLGQHEGRQIVSILPGPYALIESEYVHRYQVEHSLNTGFQVRVKPNPVKEPLPALAVQPVQILAAVNFLQPWSKDSQR